MTFLDGKSNYEATWKACGHMWTQVELWKDADGYTITSTIEPVMDRPFDTITGIKCLQVAHAIFERRCKRSNCFEDNMMI